MSKGLDLYIDVLSYSYEMVVLRRIFEVKDIPATGREGQ
jgi:hypothetical protein